MTDTSNVRFMGGIMCASSAVDQTTQNLSAFGVIDQINVTAKKIDPTRPMLKEGELLVVPVNFQIITLWKRANLADVGRDIKAVVEAELLDGSGKVLQTGNFEVPLPMTIIRSRYILNVQGLPISESGEYSYQFRTIDLNGKKSEILARLCFDVNLNKE